MDLTLTQEDLDIQAKARAFTEQHLIPRELECEANGGLPPETLEELRQAVVDGGLNGYNQAKEYGGQGYTPLQQILCHEELGKATCGLWSIVWRPAYPMCYGTAAQIETYLKPSCAGERRGIYAITEPGAGSDLRQVEGTAVRRNGKYYLSAEKWFATAADVADFFLVHVHVDGDPDKPTVFFVDRDLPGVRIKRMPKFMHTYVFEHAEMEFEEVELDESKILGDVGEGFDLTKEWFIEARLEIGARCVGAATRAAEIATAYAGERVQFGRPIQDFQGVEFMIADMAVENHGVEGAALPGRLGGLARVGPEARPRACERGQAPRLRDGRPGCGPGGPDSRWARLYAGEPGRTPLPGAPRRAHMGRDIRDTTRHYRGPDQETRPTGLHGLGVEPFPVILAQFCCPATRPGCGHGSIEARLAPV